MDEYDVVIVGYGPTGLVAASLLGQRGHRVLVCERWKGLYGLPRFSHIDGETARILQGAADIDEALRDSGPTSLTYKNASGQTLLFVPASTGGVSGFADHLSIFQPDIEAALDRRVRLCDSVAVRHSRAVTGLDYDDTGVTVTTREWDSETHDVTTAAAEQVRARYVIAADGSKSTVRSLLGIDQQDFGFNERWINVDVEWIGDAPERFHDTVQTCDPDRNHMTMRIGSKRQRFEFEVLAGEDVAQMTARETAWDLLGAVYDVHEGEVEILRHLMYTFESRVALRWQVGRVFLAGDAAHTMPPALGQGACSGIRDAANISWKLDLVLRGLADEAILAEYERERRPHATALVHASIALGRIANTHDRKEAAARDAAMRGGKTPPPPFPRIESGILHGGPEGAATAPAGTLTPQARVRVGAVEGRLDDVVGSGFLLVSKVSLQLGQARRQMLSDLGVRVVRLGLDADDTEGTLSHYLDDLGADAYLARPDFVLFGAAAAADIEQLIEELTGMLVGTQASKVAAG